jgi:hypothetical protein
MPSCVSHASCRIFSLFRTVAGFFKKIIDRPALSTGLRYGKPLKSLNFSAMLIQKAYRRWHVYRNSPIALKYKRKIEGKLIRMVHFFFKFFF